MGRPPTISREQVLQAARAAFAQKGFAAATLADIAAILKVTPAAILRHFATKQDLFNAAMRAQLKLPPCIADLPHVDASTDPRIVLRRIATEWIPFARTAIVHNIVVNMHEQSNPTLVMPFNPRSSDSPPRRGLKLVSDYFRRAHAVGVIRIDDPRAAALLFMGSLVSYVFIHYVMRVSGEPYPLDKYIDSLLDLWSSGAIRSRNKGGSRGNEVSASRDRAGRGDRTRRARSAGVHARAADAEAGRTVRHVGGANGQRRVARRRPRRPDSDR